MNIQGATTFVELRLVFVQIRDVKTQTDLQKRVFVVEGRATRRWKALMPYLKMNLSKKYVHTSGTLYAHMWHTKGTAF